MAEFAKCAETTLQFEGVSSDSKYAESNGVASKFGITVELLKKASNMDDFDKNSDGRITNVDVKRLDFDDAISVYKKVYWDCWSLGDLDDQKATLVFDAAMNHGHKIAAKIVQKALIALGFDNVVADGIYGPQTRKSMLEVSTEEFIQKYFDTRMAYYNALIKAYSEQKKNLSAWEERLDALKDAISCM